MYVPHHTKQQKQKNDKNLSPPKPPSRLCTSTHRFILEFIFIPETTERTFPIIAAINHEDHALFTLLGQDRAGQGRSASTFCPLSCPDSEDRTYSKLDVLEDPRRAKKIREILATMVLSFPICIIGPG
ncbi:uncharacterized protein LOC143264262 [Megachile rotundata]|uniref:uncharacterized protein LOC143264262 n=1 Tax=Megachile rotundata TaxID=143995 RepID=UPI003FD2CAA9